MINELEQRIEEYLLSAPGDGWVKSKLLCARFGVTERQLRKVGDSPGLCTACAISGNKGFKHIERATPGEWDDYYARERTHSISALVTLRQKRTRRHQVTTTTKRPQFTREKDSGQGLLFSEPSRVPF